MKKFLFLLLCVVVVFASCNKIPSVSDVSDESETEISNSGISESGSENSGAEASKAEVLDTEPENSETGIIEDISEPEVSKTETKGRQEKLDIDCDINVIALPFEHKDGGLDGLYQFGVLKKTAKSLVLDEHYRYCFDTEEYDEWVKKYTDEWFEDNWLVEFRSYNPTFTCKEIGVYFSHKENYEPMLYFHIAEDAFDEKADPDKMTQYWTYIEIPKDSIEYDLTEFYYQSVYDDNYDSVFN